MAGARTFRSAGPDLAARAPAAAVAAVAALARSGRASGPRALRAGAVDLALRAAVAAVAAVATVAGGWRRGGRREHQPMASGDLARIDPPVSARGPRRRLRGSLPTHGNVDRGLASAGRLLRHSCPDPELLQPRVRASDATGPFDRDRDRAVTVAGHRERRRGACRAKHERYRGCRPRPGRGRCPRPAAARARCAWPPGCSSGPAHSRVRARTLAQR